MAHLAGALAAPVWVGLPFASDWRWQRQREDTPWYPTMRLFRQREWGNWEEVLARMAAELARRVRVHRAQRPTSRAAVEAREKEKQARALLQQGRLDEAVNGFRQALQQNPDAADALHSLGVALARLGKLEEAVANFTQALELLPESADLHGNLGLAYLNQGKGEEAVRHLQRALQLRPEAVETRNNLGVAFMRQKRHEEALDCFRRVLRQQPDYVEGHNNLGNALREQGQLDEAVACYRQALQLRPDMAEAHNNLGIALSRQGQSGAAAESYREAVRLKPEYAKAHNNLGVVLADLGRAEEALACYHEALRLEPGYAEAHVNRALAWLRQGVFARGWPEFEWRARAEGARPRAFRQPRWDGRPLGGRTVLLHAEQGFGDTVQFVRYAALVKQRGGRVLVECQRELLPLLGSCPGVDELIPQGAALPRFDVEAPFLSLPAILGTTVATIPAAVPYLAADAAHLERWRRTLGPLRAFKVGIAWQGNPNYRGDRFRSIPLARFEPLAGVEGVQLVSLQKGPGAEQLSELAGRFSVLDFERQLGSFQDTAALIGQLDLVVSCDTAVAHLAGALAVPVWLALSTRSDWRWLTGREDTTWYPTMRLFRQQVPGDWEEVFARIAGELQRHVGSGSREGTDPARALALQ